MSGLARPFSFLTGSQVALDMDKSIHCHSKDDVEAIITKSLKQGSGRCRLRKIKQNLYSNSQFKLLLLVSSLQSLQPALSLSSFVSHR